MSRLLDTNEVHRQIATIPAWTYADNAITRTYNFATFPIAVTWVDEMAVAAEAMDHHPDVDLRWRRVCVTLSTHSAGGVTSLDIEMAHQLDAIAATLDSAD